MRWLAVAAALLLGACSGAGTHEDPRATPPPERADDGGSSPDGGTDGGADAGEEIPPAELPELEGWTFHGTQHGGPRTVHGVTSDSSGNIWVAGGSEGLFLLEPGATGYKRFTVADGLTGYIDPGSPEVIKGHDVISVAGGPANTVFVGYRGVGIEETDPVWMLKSGDADKVVYDGAGLTVTHFDLASPPGLYDDYPDGREKVRNVLRILYDDRTGDLWFGCDHGVAMFQARGGHIWEHQHVLMMGYARSAAEDPSAPAIEMSGDFWGIALDPAGDVWTGGAHRLAKLNYASEGGQFWASYTPLEGIDVWPDPVPNYGYPEQRLDDDVSELIADPGGVWIGSSSHGLARMTSTGISYVPGPPNGMVDPKVTALEVDPKDGSLWAGHLWGGLTRIQDGAFTRYSMDVFTPDLYDSVVWDIQSDSLAGQRRILVAFSKGVIGVYTGD